MEFKNKFKELLEELCSEGDLVNIGTDLMMSFSEEESYQMVEDCRITYVGDDYIAVGPKQPLVHKYIPIDKIIWIEYSEKDVLDDETEVDDFIEKHFPTWERYNIINENYVRLGGVSTNDDKISIVLIFDDMNSATKSVKKRIDKIRTEYHNDVNVSEVDINMNKDIITFYHISELPSVLMLYDDTLCVQLDGPRLLQEYRDYIDDLMEYIDDEDEDGDFDDED